MITFRARLLFSLAFAAGCAGTWVRPPQRAYSGEQRAAAEIAILSSQAEGLYLVTLDGQPGPPSSIAGDMASPEHWLLGEVEVLPGKHEARLDYQNGGYGTPVTVEVEAKAGHRYVFAVTLAPGKWGVTVREEVASSEIPTAPAPPRSTPADR